MLRRRLHRTSQITKDIHRCCKEDYTGPVRLQIVLQDIHERYYTDVAKKITQGPVRLQVVQDTHTTRDYIDAAKKITEKWIGYMVGGDVTTL